MKLVVRHPRRIRIDFGSETLSQDLELEVDVQEARGSNQCRLTWTSSRTFKNQTYLFYGDAFFGNPTTWNAAWTDEERTRELSRYFRKGLPTELEDAWRFSPVDVKRWELHVATRAADAMVAEGKIWFRCSEPILKVYRHGRCWEAVITEDYSGSAKLSAFHFSLGDYDEALKFLVELGTRDGTETHGGVLTATGKFESNVDGVAVDAVNLARSAARSIEIFARYWRNGRAPPENVPRSFLSAYFDIIENSKTYPDDERDIGNLVAASAHVLHVALDMGRPDLFKYQMHFKRQLERFDEWRNEINLWPGVSSFIKDAGLIIGPPPEPDDDDDQW